MRVNREQLLKSLAMVEPGIASKELIEQSSCFCFRNKTVVTFNDEIAATADCPLEIEGAVPAKPLLALLQKLAEPELDIATKDGELIVMGKGRRSGIRMEPQVLLPIDSVAMPEANSWKPLHGDFCEAIETVVQCTSSDESVFNLTCVHISPDFVEACDNYQHSRYPVPTGVDASRLVRGQSARHIVGLGMTHMATTDAWFHFRNPSGLVLSCRRWAEEYPDFDQIVDFAGTKTTLPGSLPEALAKAEIFSGENASGNLVQVELKPGKLRIKGVGALGWYEERAAIQYDGEDLCFLIAPKLLASLVAKSAECEVAEGKLKIASGKFTYVACLLKPEGAVV